MSKLKHYLKMLLGWTISKVRPAYAKQIENDLSAPYWGKGKTRSIMSNKFDRFVRHFIAHKDNNNGRGEHLEQYHQGFWRSKLDTNWYKKTANEFESKTLPRLESLFNELDRVVAQSNFTSICEIGTGDGKLLDYLQRRFSGIERFIGLDLSADQMAANNVEYSGIEFHACEAAEWIISNCNDRTLYVTSGGVFEYFSQGSLESLLAFIAQNQPQSAVAIMYEPIVDDHDLDNEKQSRLTTAGEFSFSHNYPHLIEQAGLQIVHLLETKFPDYRGITIFAQVKNPIK